MSLHKFRRRRKDGKSFSLGAFREESESAVCELTGEIQIGFSLMPHIEVILSGFYTMFCSSQPVRMRECVWVKDLWTTVGRTLANRLRLQTKSGLTLFQSELSLNIAFRVTLGSTKLRETLIISFPSFSLSLCLNFSLSRSLLLVISNSLSVSLALSHRKRRRERELYNTYISRRRDRER